MMKQILVLNGGPRRGGNTDKLVAALMDGVDSAGYISTELRLRELNIGPCVGCLGCVAKKGNPCVQKDDMQQVYDAIRESCCVVFASPLYWWTVTGPLKTCIDRLFAVAGAHDMQFPNKDTALLIAAEGTTEENFALVKEFYQTALVKNIHWNDKGMVLAAGVAAIGDVEKTGYLDEARKLGASLYSKRT